MYITSFMKYLLFVRYQERKVRRNPALVVKELRPHWRRPAFKQIMSSQQLGTWGCLQSAAGAWRARGHSSGEGGGAAKAEVEWDNDIPGETSSGPNPQS